MVLVACSVGRRAALAIFAHVVVHTSAQPNAIVLSTPSATECVVVDSYSPSEQLGSPAGTPCVFPFEHLGVIHNRCTQPVTGVDPWCATSDWSDDNVSHTWGYCGESCLHITTGDLDLEATPISHNDAEDSDMFLIITGVVVGVALLLLAILFFVTRARGNTKLQNVKRPTSAQEIPMKSSKLDEGGLASNHDSEVSEETHIYDIAQSTENGVKIAPVHVQTVEAVYQLAKQDTNFNSRLDTNESEGAQTEYDHQIENDLSNPVPADFCDVRQTSNEVEGAEPVLSPGVEKEKVGARRTELQRAMESRLLATIPSEGEADLSANPMRQDIRNAKVAQDAVSKIRRVNEQARGEFSGQKTHVDMESRAVKVEVAAQQNLNNERRVNVQARGTNVGEQTAYDGQAVNIVRGKAQQAEVSKIRRVNEQARGEFVGQKTGFGSGAVVVNLQTNNQKEISKMRKVNEQARGEFAGQKTQFNADAVVMKTIANSQNMTSQVRRVNEQARGELVGEKTKFGIDSINMSTIANVGKMNSLATQKKQAAQLVGVPTNFDTKSMEMSKYKNNQAVASNALRERGKGMTGNVIRTTEADASYHVNKDEYMVIETNVTPDIKSKFERMMSPTSPEPKRSNNEANEQNKEQQEQDNSEDQQAPTAAGADTEANEKPKTRVAEL